MGNEISREIMQSIYEEMKTPKKIGIVLHEKGSSIDCPTVFRKEDGTWGMVFAKYIPGEKRDGYETWMASSKNLTEWKIEGKLLAKKEQGWDCCQADGGMALIDTTWNGSYEVKKYNECYWMTYIGGALPGYETDPLSIGLAYSKTMKPGSWIQMKKPVLRSDDETARNFEKATLYKSTVIFDQEKRLDAPFVMFYNAKQKGCWIERIGIAVSHDMIHWKRIGADSVLENGNNHENIAGDPQLIQYGDLWVMHYFVAEDGTAYDTFACSRDLLNWTKWEGKPLIAPSESYDATYAHKPFVLKHEGKVYHFYCAVGSQGRCIALATS